MRATKLNNVLLFVLVTAFLTMQWTATHIHLSQKHNHSGSHHQHKVENHNHDLTDKYVIDYAIDESHEVSHANVVNIDHKYTLSKSEKQKYTSLAVAPPSYQLPQTFLPTSVKIPVNLNTKLSYFDRSTVNPRAPPKTS